MAKENTSITNAFKIVTLLKKNGHMQIAELVKELSVEERQVRRYVNSLRNAVLILNPGQEYMAVII